MMQKGPNMTNFQRTMMVHAEEECNAEREFNHGTPVSRWGKRREPRFFLANGRRDPLTAEADLTAVR
jgi:hypothetical protein